MKEFYHLIHGKSVINGTVQLFDKMNTDKYYEPL